MIGLNIAINYLLLLGTSKVSGIGAKRIRILVSAVMGGLYSGVCVVWGQPISISNAGRFFVMIIISMIAFGVGRQSVKRGLIFLMLNMALDGVMAMLQRSDEFSFVVCAAIISFICGFLRRNGALGKRFSKIEIHHCGKVFRFEALHDTGNCLIDPVSGENMLVIGPRAASELTGLTREELASPVNTLREGRVKGSWLVPFSSVGKANGLMLAMRFPDTVLDGKHTKVVAALAPEGMDEYDVLIGG